MIKIGIISNYRDDLFNRINRIEEALSSSNNYQVRVFHFSFNKINEEKIENLDGLILSGSASDVSKFRWNKDFSQKFKSEVTLIQKTSLPILGICFGLHLIAYAFQLRVKRNENSNERNEEINIRLKTPELDTLIPYKEICVEVNHRDYVSPNDEHIPEHFFVKAISRDDYYQYVQYMKNKHKTLYCVQFHPETREKYDDGETNQIGRDILSNFIKIVVNSKRKKVKD